MLDLDLGFLSADLFQKFIQKGLRFSVQLTVVAMLGGILFGALLAMMRLPSKRWLSLPATAYVNGMRSIPLVMVIPWFFLLIPFVIGRPIGAYDLLKGFEISGKNLNRPIAACLLAAVCYFSICCSLSYLVKRLQRRIAIIR